MRSTSPSTGATSHSTGAAEQMSSPAASIHRTYTHREILEIILAVLAALFTAMLSTTIVSTALPTLMADLGGTQRQYTWVITASLLAMTVSTPIWGKLSDLFSKKILTQVSIAMFVIGSLVAGMTNDITVLMSARAVQGLAMGGLTALAQAIMGVILSPRDRGRYAGYMGATMAIATVSGPLLGGWITDTLGWRWCFFLPLPLAVVAFVLLQAKLDLPRIRQEKARIDYAGAVLVAIGAALPMLWVTFAGTDYEWISAESAYFLIGFLLVAIALIIVELKVPEPMLPLRSLGNRTTVLMIIASLGAGIAMFGSGVFITQYFQLGLGDSPSKAGIMIIPLILAQTISATAAGQIVSRTGRYKLLMLIASVLLVAGLFGMGTINENTSLWVVIVSMIIFGLGIGGLIQNVVLAVQNVVDFTEIGAVSAAVSFFRSLGGAVGVAVLGAILTMQVSNNMVSGITAMGVPADQLDNSGDTSLDISGLPAPIQELFHNSYANAFGHLFLITAFLAIVSFVAILLVRETPLRTTIELIQEPVNEKK